MAEDDGPVFKDPVGSPVKAVAGSEAAYSWLGKWGDVGWSIRISPRLTEAQWGTYGKRADETWDEAARSYSSVKSLELLGELFPTHTLTLVWPKCTYRTAFHREGQVPLYVLCGQRGTVTQTHLRDVYDNKVALARCTQHQGQL